MMFTLVKVFHDISYMTIWIKIIHLLCAATRFSHNFKAQEGIPTIFLENVASEMKKRIIYKILINILPSKSDEIIFFI